MKKNNLIEIFKHFGQSKTILSIKTFQAIKSVPKFLTQKITSHTIHHRYSIISTIFPKMIPTNLFIYFFLEMEATMTLWSTDKITERKNIKSYCIDKMHHWTYWISTLCFIKRQLAKVFLIVMIFFFSEGIQAHNRKL